MSDKILENLILDSMEIEPVDEFGFSVTVENDGIYIYTIITIEEAKQLIAFLQAQIKLP